MLISQLLPLDLADGVILLWLLLGTIGLLAQKAPKLVINLVFPLGAVGGALLVVAGLWSLPQAPDVVILPLGLPDLPFHLRLDALAAFFLMVLGVASTGVSIFAAGYFKNMPGATLGLLCLQYHVFLASMAVVLLADDAYLFMVAWETMALASYFLVTTDHTLPEIRKAGFLYFLMAHVGAIAILLCFGLLQGGHGDYTFNALRHATLDPTWSSLVFVLALLGFGAKAGLVPVHVWLPEAHPAAPSPVSALMSGVMLKTAIYGFLRVSFDLLAHPLWWWGVLALVAGLITALFGAIYAATQTDMKRLLAYSSIENIGIVFAGIGLSLIFFFYGMHALAALSLAAALYHCVNHALFKSLLFCCTGAVLHATGERNLGRLGGLIRVMPRAAVFALIGALAIAGLPPLNGFVSEWLLLQAFLLTPGLPQSYLNMLIPVAAGALALVAALSAYVMVKFFGVVFLGQHREARLSEAHDIGRWEFCGLAWLTLGCLLLAFMPVAVMLQLDHVTGSLIHAEIGASALQNGWLFLTPLSSARASYSAPIFLLVIAVAVLITFIVVHRVYHGRVRRSAPWDCGFPEQTPRMQDTAEGFGQPIHQIFEPFFRIERLLPTPFDLRPEYRKTSEDRLWYALYLPVVQGVERITAVVAKLHHGRMALYLMYSFATLLVLLAFVR